MKNISEIQEAHDRLAQTILGEAPSPFEKERTDLLIAAADVLCWVLEHDHNQSFANNLQAIKEYQEERGYRLIDHGN